MIHRSASQGRQRRSMPPPPVHIPARQPYDRPERRASLPTLLFFLALIFACGTLALATAGWFYQREKIMPGVETLDISLGGLNVQEATRQLDANWRARRVRLNAEGQAVMTVPVTDLGIVLDADATARAAFRQGRDFSNPPETIQALLGKASVQPIWYFDPAVARQKLSSIAAQFEVAPVNAGIEIVDGKVNATPPHVGQRLDIEATTAWLQQNAVRLAFGEPFPIVVQEVSPDVVDVAPLVDQLNQRLATPLTINAFDPIDGESQRVEIAPEEWAAWLKLEADTSTSPPLIMWEVDTNRVTTYVETHNQNRNDGRYFEVESTAAALTQAIQQQQSEVQQRVRHHPRQHVVQAGQTLSSIAYDYGIPYPWIQHANPDLGDTLAVGQAILVPSPDELLPLPIVENKRIVVSIAQQRLWAYENGALKWEWPISTGIDSSPTAPGVFQIQSHEPNAYASIWDLWMPQFMGIYRPVPTSDFMNGFHGFPTRNGTNLLWTNSLGRKVTYGCILVSNDNIALLYEWAEEGVVVEVQP